MIAVQSAIIVGKGQQFASRGAHRTIKRPRFAGARLRECLNRNTRVRLRPCFDDLSGIVLRAVIDHDNFSIERGGVREGSCYKNPGKRQSHAPGFE